MATQPKYPQVKVTVDRNGESGGPINILVNTCVALDDAGASVREIEEFVRLFKISDYETNLRRVASLVTLEIIGE